MKAIKLADPKASTACLRRGVLDDGDLNMGDVSRDAMLGNVSLLNLISVHSIPFWSGHDGPAWWRCLELSLNGLIGAENTRQVYQGRD